jgi:hypothetical protein
MRGRAMLAAMATYEYRYKVERARIAFNNWMRKHRNLRPNHCERCGIECKPARPP